MPTQADYEKLISDMGWEPGSLESSMDNSQVYYTLDIEDIINDDIDVVVFEPFFGCQRTVARRDNVAVCKYTTPSGTTYLVSNPHMHIWDRDFWSD